MGMSITLIQQIHDLVWGIPLIVLIMVVGLWLTIRLKGIQITKLAKAFRCLFQKEEGNGEVSTFQALCISISATVGTGNITGVATAIVIGGPGALFWMVITAFLGMAIKYAEGFLATKYRRIENDRLIGGPYAYIEYGMGKKFKWLAKAFAICGTFAAILGIGTMTQMNGIVDAAKNVFDKDGIYMLTLFGHPVSIVIIITGVMVTCSAALILIGGVKRIGSACEKIVPVMAIAYIVICLIILGTHMKTIPESLLTIVKMAFTGQAAAGGVVAITVRNAIQEGVAKGIFSNEAGLGSAPIALATGKSNHPVHQGLMAMTSTFLGTVIICTLTGLCIVVTGAWSSGHQGISITNYAFTTGLPFPSLVGSILLLLCIVCFAFTTIVGWNLYGVRCLDYLTNGNKRIEKVYQWIYILALLMGAFLEINTIWNIAEICNAFMALPNLIALLALSGVIAKETKESLAQEKMEG